MTQEEIFKRRELMKRFYETELGSAFRKFDISLAHAQQLDAHLEYQDRGEKAAKEAWKHADNDREVLMKMLLLFAGIQETDNAITTEPSV